MMVTQMLSAGLYRRQTCHDAEVQSMISEGPFRPENDKSEFSLMPLNKIIKHSKISNGQYTVTINLRGIPGSEKFQGFDNKLQEIANDYDDVIDDIYKYDGNKLSYTSETLFPANRYVNKQKLLIVFGNPAIHSIKNKMFFFSRAKSQRHGMWGKLEKANLIKRVRINDDDLFLARAGEAEERK